MRSEEEEEEGEEEGWRRVSAIARVRMMERSRRWVW